MARLDGRPADGRRRARQLRALTELSRALTYVTTRDEVLSLAVLRSRSIFAAGAALTLLADQEGMLIVRSLSQMRGAPEQLRQQSQDPWDVNLPELLLCDPQQRILAVPLVVGGVVLGLLAVLPSALQPAHDDEEWLLSALADQVAVAVEKVRLDAVADFRERLIGIVSHDLRTPITVILLATDRLQAVLSAVPKAHILVRRIRRSAQRAQRMIDDLLDFTRVRLGDGLQLTLRVVDLAALAASAVDDAEGQGAGSRVCLRQSGVTEGPFDGDRVAQLIGNLLANALAYGDGRGPVTLAVERQEGTVCLSVHNHGKPIPNEALAKVFEPMHQGAGGARAGLGLGLFICRHIAQAHGGTIEVCSGAEEGTTFSVRLPLKDVPVG